MSKAAQHTAGDWGVEDPMDHCLTIVANPEAPVYDWIWVATCDWPDEDNHNITSEQVKANASLIASAPRGLTANREALDFIQSYFGPVSSDDPGGWSDEDARKVAEILRAAIAKASGDEQ